MNGMPTRLVNQLNKAGSDSIDLLEVEFEQKVELDNSSEILDTKLSDNVSKDLLKEYEDDYTLKLTLQTTVGLHVNDIHKEKIDAAMTQVEENDNNPYIQLFLKHEIEAEFYENGKIFFIAANYTNNQTLYNIGWQHANRTLYEHFRENNSTYHVILYNQTDGSVIRKYTSQGYADWSTWARGHSWGIYGFTTAYRYTKYQPFLDKAIGATNYVLTHLPSSSDLVTYWDYDAPYNSTLPYQPRDTSAAAIFASALVELAQYVPTSEMKDRFLSSARAIVDQLSTPKYLIYGNKNYQLPALLANGTIGPYPERPYDVALSFGDYHLTQAIVRLTKL